MKWHPGTLMLTWRYHDYVICYVSEGCAAPLAQLCQRPFNRDCGRPNHNQDSISPMFRDHVMPARHAAPPLQPGTWDIS